MEKRICPNCKVELEKGMDKCPLCEKSISKKQPDGNGAVYPSELLNRSTRKSKIYTWELFSIIAFSATLISLIVDLVIENGLDWSLYAITSIVGVWLISTSFTFFHKRPLILGVLLIICTLSMLVLYDLINPPINWFVSLGMPIGLSLGILFTSFLFLLDKLKTKGFNVLGFVLVFISAFTICIEVFTDLYISGMVVIRWSAITSVALVPVSWVLLFLHYRLKKGNSLESFFHI